MAEFFLYYLLQDLFDTRQRKEQPEPGHYSRQEKRRFWVEAGMAEKNPTTSEESHEKMPRVKHLRDIPCFPELGGIAQKRFGENRVYLYSSASNVLVEKNLYKSRIAVWAAELMLNHVHFFGFWYYLKVEYFEWKRSVLGWKDQGIAVNNVIKAAISTNVFICLVNQQLSTALQKQIDCQSFFGSLD